MAYIFPKRALKAKDVLDPIELNQDFIPAAEESSGKLNTHNIEFVAEPFKPKFYSDGVSKTAYYSYYESSATSNPGFGYPGGYSWPNRASTTSEHVLSNDMEWDSIDSASITLTTAVSSLWIIGRVQYIWLGFAKALHTYSNAGTESDERGALVQFAIRLNGNVLIHTITGEFDPFMWGVVPISAERTRSTTSRYPGVVGRRVAQPTGLGPECMSVRLGITEQVQPGTHTVEIVARRVPLLKEEGYEDSPRPGVEPNRIVVYNRNLFVLDLPTYPASTTTASAVDVPAYSSESVVDAEGLGVSRIYKVRDALNNIQQGSLARGAFSHYHLRSPVVAKAQQTLFSNTEWSFSNTYPGFHNNETITTGSGSSDNGWTILKSSTGKKLQVLNTTDEPFSDLSTTPSVFLILANINLYRIYHSNTDDVPDHFAAFAIGLKEYDGDEYVLKNSIGFVNHFAINRFPEGVSSSGSTNRETIFEKCDVALCAVLKSSDVGAQIIEEISVYGSTLSQSAASAKAIIKNANISVIRLRV